MSTVYFVYAQIGPLNRIQPDPDPELRGMQMCDPCKTSSSLLQKVEDAKNQQLSEGFVLLVPSQPVEFAPRKTFWQRVSGLKPVEFEAGDWTLWEEDNPPATVVNADSDAYADSEHISVFVVPSAQYDQLNEERDKVSEMRLLGFKDRDNEPPSSEAVPDTFRKSVGSKKLAFAFGREMNANLKLIPISLFHPEFGQFLDDLRTGPLDYHLQPLAWQFCRELEPMFEKDVDREQCLHKLLFKLFGAEVDKQKLGDYKTGIQDTPFSSHPGMPLLVEVKVETTTGSADAVFEVELYYEKAVRLVLEAKDTEAFWDLRQSRLPSVLIVHNGPNFQIFGGIWNKTGQIDVLSPSMPVYFNSQDIRAKEDWLRFLTAVRRLFRSMRDIYTDLPRHAVSSSQLEYPYPRDYIPNVGNVPAHQQPVAFRYVERASDIRLVFTACTSDGETDGADTDERAKPDIIVKFVTNDRYGVDAHLAAAAKGIAPELLSCTSLPGGLRMVVMKHLPADFVRCSSLETIPVEARKAINDTVALFHGLGHVHGDLRASNVFVREVEHGRWESWLIDFDWACRVPDRGVHL